MECFPSAAPCEQRRVILTYRRVRRQTKTPPVHHPWLNYPPEERRREARSAVEGLRGWLHADFGSEQRLGRDWPIRRARFHGQDTPSPGGWYARQLRHWPSGVSSVDGAVCSVTAHYRRLLQAPCRSVGVTRLDWRGLLAGLARPHDLQHKA